ncbi:MAG: sigma-70 family RNA polymerase sigma factor [Sedimentisphaerales bacterium]|nr:sigma-70 family RNA polymerase sigma factor [Sedimentisphaerales bacterium]
MSTTILPPSISKENVESLFTQHYQLVDLNLQRYKAKFTGSRLDDIRSDAEFGLFTAIRSFDPDKSGDFKTHADFAIRRAIKDGFRDRYRQDQHNIRIDALEPDTEPYLQYEDEGLAQIDNRDLLESLLARLNDDSRGWLELHYLQELSIPEIAQLKNITIRQVQRNVKAALDTLKEIAQAHD